MTTTRQDADLQSTIDALSPWYHRLDFGGGVTSPAPRSQQIEFDLIAPHVKGGFASKRILELGANAGGLSKLLIEAGAQVTALEPVEPFASQAALVKQHFGLSALTLVKDTIYNAHRLGQFDIVVFHGLIYHLRYPQLALDMVAHLATEQLFISSQIRGGTDASSDPMLVNRRANTRFRRLKKDQGPLLGWEPTLNALSRMLELAGFPTPKLISFRRPDKPHPGEVDGMIASNDAYFVCDAASRPAPVPYIFDERLGSRY